MKSQNENPFPSSTWRKSTSVSIVQAALLMLDIEPQGMECKVESLTGIDQPRGYLAARNALETAIKHNELKGELRQIDFSDVVGGPVDPWDHLNYHDSFLMMTDLKAWLVEHGHECALVRQPAKSKDDWRDAAHPRYSERLVAAVEAWESYDEYSHNPGTPRQKIENWLIDNAPRLKLLNKEGQPALKVIGKLADAVNWSSKPGRPKKLGPN